MQVNQLFKLQLRALTGRRLQDHPNIHPMQDGHAVARSSDFIIYSVEAEFIEKVVAEYGPCTFKI